MDAKARNCLLQHREALEKDIKTSYIMDHMISDGVLTPSEEEKVKNEVKPSEAVCASFQIFRTYALVGWLVGSVECCPIRQKVVGFVLVECVIPVGMHTGGSLSIFPSR